MSVWRPTSSKHQPVTTLVDWQVFDVPRNDPTKGSTRHFVGLAVESEREGRVSSAIQEFDVSKGQGRSGSGRIYRLQGAPGTHPDAQYVWKTWQRVARAPDPVDVTQELYQAMQRAQRRAA